MSQDKGKFIVFEGIDGCGKGTQLKLSHNYLWDKSKDCEIYSTREPTFHSKEIREKMKSDMDVNMDAEWYAQHFVDDRKNHVKLDIEPRLERGSIVFCDRFSYSTFAYQHTQGLRMSYLIKLHEGIIVPDLVLLYDCPVEIAFERRKNEGATDVFDKDLEFQIKLRSNYLLVKESLENHNIVVIDSSRSINDVFHETKSQLDLIIRD